MAKMDWTKARNRRKSDSHANDAWRTAQAAARRLAPIRAAKAKAKIAKVAEQARQDDRADNALRPLSPDAKRWQEAIMAGHQPSIAKAKARNTRLRPSP